MSISRRSSAWVRWPRIALTACLCATLYSVARDSFAQPPTPATAAQTAEAPPLHFDIVSVRQNTSGSKQMSRQSASDTDGITMTNVPAILLVYYAYRVNDEDGLSGLPDWTQAERYDIAARVAPADVPAYQKLTKEQRSQMFLTVLEDRFQIRTHRETHDRPVYALTVGKGGLRIKPATPDEKYPALASGSGFVHGGTIFATGAGKFTAQGATMSEFAILLSNYDHQLLGRDVVDRTGLTGRYDFTWQPPGDSQQDAAGAAAAMLPALQDALADQLGLKLVSATAPTQRIVVDHIERPSAN